MRIGLDALDAFGGSARPDTTQPHPYDPKRAKTRKPGSLLWMVLRPSGSLLCWASPTARRLVSFLSASLAASGPPHTTKADGEMGAKLSFCDGVSMVDLPFKCRRRRDGRQVFFLPLCHAGPSVSCSPGRHRLRAGCWGFSLGGAASCRWSVVLAVADGETVGEPPSGRAHPNELPAQPRVVYEIERVPTPPLAKPRPMRLPRHEAAGMSVRHPTSFRICNRVRHDRSAAPAGMSVRHPTSFRICNRVRHDRSAAPAGMSVRHPTSFRRSLAPCVPASSLTCPQPRRAPPRHRSPPPAPSVRPPARRRSEDRFVLGVRPFASPPRHQPVAQHRSDRSISLPIPAPAADPSTKA